MNIKRIAVAVPLLVVLGGCEIKARVHTEPATPDQKEWRLLQTRTAFVWRDPVTGCEYIALTGVAALTPRLTRFGKQVCAAQ